MILGLLTAEIIARLGRDPGEIYSDPTRAYGEPIYERVEAPATPGQKAVRKVKRREVILCNRVY